MAKCYLLLVILGLIYSIVGMTKSAFAGIYLVVLTIPWSFMTSALLDKWQIQDSIPIVLKMAMLLGEAFVNACILYWVGAMIEKTRMEGVDK